MVINLGVTRVFHLNHRDVRVDENPPQRSHDFFKTGGVFTAAHRGGVSFMQKLFNLKDPNFPEPERRYRPLNLSVVMESNHKETHFHFKTHPHDWMGSQ